MKITPKQPKKLGRPSVYKIAMTPAERQSRYRERIRREARELLQRIQDQK